MKKLIIISSVATIIIIGGILYAFNSSYQGELNTEDISQTSTQQNQGQNRQNGQQNQNRNNATQISMEEFQTHNNESDCWVLFNGGVYDITNYLKLHPGGPDPILPTCGKLNFEEEFTNFHGQREVKSFKKQSDYQGEINEE